MEFGAHLPLILGNDERPPDAAWISDYAATAESLGFTAVSSNDHVMYRSPWLDGPTALAVAAAATKRVRIATSVLIPAIRHPFVAAKMLATLDVLSGGRVVAGVGPGSYQPDYDATGVPFDERWKRLDACVLAMRGIWQDDEAPASSGPYAFAGVNMRPRPIQPGGPPIWIGSWGSTAGLRRVARIGDGWLASAYNTTPEKFGEDWVKLGAMLRERGKQPESFPNALVTMFTYVTDDPREVERAVQRKLGPAVGRSPEELGGKLLMGSAEECARRVRVYADAGVQRIFIWPAADEIRQLEIFASRVLPQISRRS